MNASSMADSITSAFPGVETATAFGYTLFFYRSERKLPFATLISSDQAHDRVSDLDRPGVYRLNIGIGRQTFEALFGAAERDAGGCDFTALDVIMPHPHYAKQNFVCVLSPGEATLDSVRRLLAEAYEIAVRRHERRSDNR